MPPLLTDKPRLYNMIKANDMVRTRAAAGVCRRAARLAFGLAISLPVVACAQATGGPTAIFVVRHAEKDTIPHENPPLNPAGRARADSLVTALRDAGVTVIVTTQQFRTQQTAAPLAAALHITPISVPIDGTKPEEHVRAVAEAVRRSAHAGDVVLVVDHQSTLPGIVAALGAPKPATMCDVEFSNLYILLPASANGMRLTHAHYGTPDPPHDRSCKITPMSPP
jgi:phosphohistidine phosphatase SixA